MPNPTPLPPPPLTAWQIIWRNVVALSIGTVAWFAVAEQQFEEAAYLGLLDLTLGVITMVAYQFRRRWPFAVAMFAAIVSFFSASSAGAGSMAFISLATRRRWIEMIPVAVVAIVGGQFFYETQPDHSDDTWYANLLLGLAFTAIAIAIGMYIGARRDLLASLQDRAERAEREQSLQVARAQAEERNRIAREMHDVLAHRMSLVAMHAGALAYRDNLKPDETREAAEVIQANSHRALTDLREILGVLRDAAPGSPDTATRHRPQPTLCDLEELISDEAATGARVKLDNQLDMSVEVPSRSAARPTESSKKDSPTLASTRPTPQYS